jgi:gentisate 1,2-dioxygenase
MAVEPQSPAQKAQINDIWSRKSPYDRWLESSGLLVHEGYFISDARTVELKPWDEREVDAAVFKLAGQQGFTEARVSEMRPGATVPPQRFSFDEAIYVLDGRGLTSIWSEDTGERRSFEWQKHSMFIVPRGHFHQFSNTQGNRPARLLHFNYLPLAMAANPDPSFHFANRHSDPAALGDADVYSEAKVGTGEGPHSGMGYWMGNFFADMRAWDRLDPFRGRGAGGHAVFIQFPTSPLWAHMSVFPAQSYKKAHRHGPGVVIVIPAGEGFSVMWPEGREKVFIPWQEGSVFVPPDRWFHQHFNVTGEPARYLALHSPRHFNMSAEAIEDPARDQIEYPDEDPRVREYFENELGKRGLKSLMPEEAYTVRGYEWKY